MDAKTIVMREFLQRFREPDRKNVGVELEFPLLNLAREPVERHVALAHRVEDVAQALDLRLVLGKQAGGIALFAVVADVVGQQFELLVELRLRRGME